MLVSRSDWHTQAVTVSGGVMGILQPICPTSGKGCQSGGGVGAVAATGLWRVQQHPSTRVHFSCGPLGKLIVHPCSRPRPTSHPATQGPVPQNFSRPRAASKWLFSYAREHEDGLQKLAHRGKLQPVTQGLLPILRPKGLAGLGLLISQLQGSASTRITFLFLQKSPADMRQCESQLSDKGFLPHGNFLQASNTSLMSSFLRRLHKLTKPP